MVATRASRFRDELAASMNRTICKLALVMIAGVAAGCRQPNTPGAPFAPVPPFGADTRVPPPATGSYKVPGGYYQGQASRGSQQQPGGLSANVPDTLQPTPTEYAAAEAANATVAAGDGPPTDWSSMPSSTAGGVRQASYVEGNPTPTASGAAQPDGIRPRLDGMRVVDLSNAAGPAAPPVSGGIPPAPAVGGGADWGPPVSTAADSEATDFPQSSPDGGIPVQASGGSGNESLHWRPPFR